MIYDRGNVRNQPTPQDPHKIKKKNLLSFSRKETVTLSTLDLTFNILQTWQEIQHSVHLNTKKDSQWDQYILWNQRGGINTCCWRELLVHVMNISACTGRKKEQAESE